ncbi:MAG: hypothetical protein HOP28_03275 [Gemmatimonadales bacterium]|nr:hypothetical protein [Gemmatimonadales bacterium]
MITYAFTLLAALQAPGRDSLLAEGIRLAGPEPAAALIRFERILAADSNDATALWRAAVAHGDISLPLTAKKDRPRRDSLLGRGILLARRAKALAPNDPQTHFALGVLLGNSALTKGVRDRVKLAVEIRDLARAALAADSTHDGAHHLLGRWHYEIRKLSGFERFVARSFLGGGVFGEARWEEAERHLARAVELDSTRIYHRLDLARVQIARKEAPAALAQLRRIQGLPNRVAADTTYRREAGELLGRITSSAAGSPSVRAAGDRQTRPRRTPGRLPAPGVAVSG